MSLDRVLAGRRARLSPAKLALLEKIKGTVGGDKAPSVIPRRARTGRVPLSFQQQRMWSLDKLVPDSPAYNVVLTFRLDGEVHPELLERAVNEIVRRHEALRTTFPDEDGRPWQEIADELTVPLPVTDLSDLPGEAEQEAELARLTASEARHVFDLARGPLLRVRLYRLAADTYTFLLNTHHIVIDGWSINNLVRELLLLHRAYAAGEPSPLPEPTLQYADYTLWERERLSGAGLEQRLAYWRERLGDRKPGSELPMDHPRPPVQTFRGGSTAFDIDPEVAERLREVTRKGNSTLFVTLAGALKILMCRWTGDERVVIGTPIANRHHRETEDLIGFFVNTLVLDTDLSGNPPAEEALQRVAAVAKGAYAHQDMPFELLVNEFRPERGMSMNPLFQVCFALQTAPAEEAEDSILGPVREIRNGTSKFDLWISVAEREGRLTASVEYNADIFEHDTVRRFVDSYQVLLRSLAEDPGRRIGELSILPPEERHRILVGFNDTARPYPEAAGATLHGLVERSFARTQSGRAAVRFEGEDLTFGELDRRSAQAAHLLRELGVRRGTPVAVCMERSPEMVVALLGVLRAGGAYLPVDPGYPPQRQEFMLADSEPGILLTQGRLRDALPPHSARTVCLEPGADGLWSALNGRPTTAPGTDADPDSVAYMIYTSGSTGRPKGAMISHRAICNRLLWMQDAYGLTPDDRVLQKTPFSFDVSVWEFFWPLMTGARMVVARPEGHKDPAYLADLVRDEGVTTLHFVPSMLKAFLETDGLSGRIGSVRRVFASGEALSYSLQERFYEHFAPVAPEARLHNLYGPTEAAVDVTHWTCPPTGGPRTVPIGRPVANTRIHILDGHLNPVPVGSPGELCVGGVQVAEGYHRRPELTRERFVADPFAGLFGDGPGARLYRTGDLARYLPDGTIEYRGRTDFQVKVRGFRIEPGEIEAALGEHPAIREAVVVTHGTAGETGDATGDAHKRLVAYVVPRTDAEPTAGGTGAADEDQVDEWESVFSRTYADGADAKEADFNIVGWNSSYTGRPLPADEMRGWVESTVDRILAHGPRRVLEIGCGTGLLLARIAPSCTVYHGTDISRRGLDFVRERIVPDLPGSVRVELEKRDADDLAGLPAEGFDTVVVNSVAQYFPDVRYLESVVAQALDLLRPGGRIFLGDLRSLPLLEVFHSDVEVARADADTGLDVLRRRVAERVAQEQELVVDPALFTLLCARHPRLARAEVMLKRGPYVNELSRYRYDVVLHTEDPDEPSGADRRGGTEPLRLTWADRDTPDEARRLLAEDAHRALLVTDVPNSRVSRARWLCRELAEPSAAGTGATAGELRERAEAAAEDGADPEQWWALAADLGRTASVFWSEQPDGSYHVLLAPPGAQVVLPPSGTAARALHTYANSPLLYRLGRRLTADAATFLRDRLPEFMVPAAVVAVPELPTDANGKLDRKALPAPVFSTAAAQDDRSQPGTPEEEELLAAWSEVLGLADAGVRTDFFEAGGDSILSIRLVNKAQQRGLAVTAQDVFQHKTIEALARVARARAQEATAPRAPARTGPALDEATRRRVAEKHPDAVDAYPLSSTQEAVLHHLRHHPEPGAGVVHQRWRIKDADFDPDAFERAWRHTVRRFPVLRTSFLWESVTEPVQVVHPDAELAVARYDWRGMRPTEQERRIQAHVAAHRRQGFDLSRAPHTHVALFRLDEDTYDYLYMFSLALQDGWSYPMIMNQLFEAYDACVAGRDPVAPEPDTVFRDFCVSQAQRDLTEAEEFWRRELAGLQLPAPALAVPHGERRPRAEDPDLLHDGLLVPDEITAEIQRRAKAHALTPFTFLQAAWALHLYDTSGARDVVFGTVFSGRAGALVDVETGVGQFFNILPVRVRVDAQLTVGQWLRELQRRVGEIARHEHAPVAKVHAWAGVPRDRFLFDSYLVNETFPELPAVFGRFGARLGAEPLEFINQTEHPLRIEAVFVDGHLVLNMNTYSGGFPPGAVTGRLRSFAALLQELVTGGQDRTVAEVLADRAGRTTQTDTSSREVTP
ncbi:non-ribosomal peptide synthetase [Streptomyces sp. NRRL F-5650]|uniref:non-ribosomal peptide synthetase n=1 Tax=Streptomyces sp. NRRL F-5650 TaxID=1463868 RepID=UPI0004CBAB00|nr:non-ribosomal peptide synthetase [Streptomyces sp. NRRL F-5650]